MRAGGAPMMARLSAAAIHVLTATGAAWALLALIAAARGDWQWMFIWLGVALVVDTIDGPLARRVGVTSLLPRWSGERLDLIVDFLTYTAVPAFALTQADLLPEASRLAAGIAIMMSSLFHMSDQESKTKEAISSASRPSGTSFASICSPSCRPQPWRSPSSVVSCC
jgi:phosphatidylcholine synthase